MGACIRATLINNNTTSSSPVPRKVLKDVYDSATEQDEPDQMELDGNMDPDELYDDDQFYRENEAIPPAPKLQGDLSRPRGTIPPTSYTIPASSVPTTVEPPYQRRDDNLEGKLPTLIHRVASRAFPSSCVITVLCYINNICLSLWLLITVAPDCLSD